MRMINRFRAPAAFAESRISPAGAKGAAIANAGKGNRLARYWFATACSALACLVAPTAASANTSIGCWGLDRSGKRFVGTSVKDFAKLDYNGLMLVINSWKGHARSLGYDLVECNVHDSRPKTVASLIQRRDWNRENSQSTSRWMDDFEAPKPRPEPGKVYFGGSSSSPTKARAAPAAAPSKYVEVAGPDGLIRLSPEVVARNKAAADDYRRKMEEHARARAEHERKLALHQQSQAAAAAEQRAYQQQLAMNDAQVAAHAAALAQHAAATRPAAKGVKGWMYCDARGAPGDKRRFYSRVVEVDYIPGQVTIIDVMGRNRPAFKAYVAGTHSIFFATDSLVHCPYSTTSMADAEALMTRDKRGDANNGITVTQTGWTPAS